MTDSIDFDRLAESPEYDGPPGERIPDWAATAPIIPPRRERSDDEMVAVAEQAAAQAKEADRPDVPIVEPPHPGHVSLIHGVIIDNERTKSATVRELNGADEEILARLDQSAWNYNTLVQDALIRRCTTSIGSVDTTVAEGKKILSELILGDRDTLFSEILFATYGRKLTMHDMRCPHCSAVMDFHVDFDELMDKRPLVEGLDPDGFDVTVELIDGSTSTYRLRYPKGKDQLEVWSSTTPLSGPEIDTAILSRIVSSENGRPIGDGKAWARNAPKTVRRDLTREVMKQPLIMFKEVEVPCVECGEKLPVAIGWADLL